MKLQVLQENLSKSLSICSRFTSNKIQLPVLANILLKTSKNKLILVATNLETSISLTIGAKVEKEGEITVPAKTVTDLISNLNLGTIDLSGEKEILKITTTGFESSVSGINSSDFPSVPQDISAETLKISTKDLIDALSCVLFAVSVDETRPILTGVLIIVRKDNITFVATDGFRLSQKKIKIENTKDERKVIIPRSILLELLRLSSESDYVNFSFRKADNQVILGFSDLILSSRIIEGEFPDFERIIPKDAKFKIRVDKEDLLRAVKLASVFARDSANVIKLVISKSYIEVLAESSRSGSQKTKIEAKILGENSNNFTIAFNYRFLEEFLSVIKGEEVNIELSDSNSPALFLDPKDINYLHVIMPVRIQS